jgi:hypothetical protein
VQFGRPRKLNTEQAQVVRRLLDEGGIREGPLMLRSRMKSGTRSIFVHLLSEAQVSSPPQVSGNFAPCVTASRPMLTDWSVQPSHIAELMIAGSANLRRNRMTHAHFHERALE